MNVDQALRLALQHHQAGRLAEAEKLYRQLLEENPNYGDALHLLGILAGQTRRAELSVELIGKAVAINPNSDIYLGNYGKILTETGRTNDAVAALRRAVAIKPQSAALQCSLGNALRQQGNFDEAIAAYRAAIKLKGDYVEAIYNLGGALKDNGQNEAAIEAYRAALRLRPNFPEALNGLGVCLKEMREPDQAIAAFSQALALKPNDPSTLNNLGNTYCDKDDRQRAMQAFQQALQADPNHAPSHANLGRLMMEAGQIDRAIESFGRAIALNPENADSHVDLAFASLLKGNFPTGLREMEYRWRSKSFAPEPAMPQPRWNGEAFPERRLLLFYEQGLGDTIQMIRYAPLIAQRGGQVILVCQPELARLLESVEGLSQVVRSDERLPAFDLRCPLMALPGIFQTTLETIRARVPYLKPSMELTAGWVRKLGPANGRKRIGLAWAGNPAFKADRTRSMNISQLAPLANVTGPAFYSLQKGAAGEQVNSPPAGLKLINLAPELNDMADTAALMSQLDLIITTDTSIAHLAGALGKPVWVMLQFVPDWRWMLGRQDSPWYPTMKLFRQKTPGDWAGVVAAVAEALGRM